MTINSVREVLMEREKEFYDKLEQRGVSRRAFMKYCTALTATMGSFGSSLTFGIFGGGGFGPEEPSELTESPGSSAVAADLLHT